MSSQEQGLFVYVVGDDEGPQKIGVSRCAAHRFIGIWYDKAKMFGGEDSLRFLATYLLPNSIARQVERDALASVRPHRVGLGWFDVPPDCAVGAVWSAIPDQWKEIAAVEPPPINLPKRTRYRKP